MIDHIDIRNKLVRRYFERPGSVAQIAAEEFPEADAVDVEAARRHVDCQTAGRTLSQAIADGRELRRPRRRWAPGAV